MAWNLNLLVKSVVPSFLIERFVVCENLDVDIITGFVFVAHLAGARTEKLLRAVCGEFQNASGSFELPNVYCFDATWFPYDQENIDIDPLLLARGSGVLCIFINRRSVGAFTGADFRGMPEEIAEFLESYEHLG